MGQSAYALQLLTSAADKLEKINERAVRFVFRDNNTSHSELLNNLGLSSLVN